LLTNNFGNMTRQKKSGIYKVARLISDEFGALQEAPVSGEKREQGVRSLTFIIQTAQGEKEGDRLLIILPWQLRGGPSQFPLYAIPVGSREMGRPVFYEDGKDYLHPGYEHPIPRRFFRYTKGLRDKGNRRCQEVPPEPQVSPLQQGKDRGGEQGAEPFLPLARRPPGRISKRGI
jgi:hypothetical protein